MGIASERILTYKINDLQHQCEDYKKLVLKYEKVYNEVKFLVESGYDGPFIGPMIEPLFKAFIESQKK